MEVKPNRSPNYVGTVELANPLDMQCLKLLRAYVSQHNKRRNLRTWRRARAVTFFRKPEFDFPGRPGRKHGWGGSVVKSQNPSHADVYVLSHGTIRPSVAKHFGFQNAKG
jgi:hypothetical protein